MNVTIIIYIHSRYIFFCVAAKETIRYFVLIYSVLSIVPDQLKRTFDNSISGICKETNAECKNCHAQDNKPCNDISICLLVQFDCYWQEIGDDNVDHHSSRQGKGDTKEDWTQDPSNY